MNVNWKKAGEWLLFLTVFGGGSAVAFLKLVEWRGGDGAGDVLLWPSVISSLVIVGYMLFQAVLVIFYRPYKGHCELPGCTVIVPAYNEGSAVADTLRSLLKSDYPKEKLEIIAVNDGSEDDTWSWIKLAARESGGIVKPVSFERNQGKKHALYHGFTNASFDVVVTVDSDSIVEPGTLAELVRPFARPEVGGVAGTVRVANIHEGFVPRALDVFFVFSCGFLRCAQSVIGAVLCSPGAISAYRKAALLPHLDGWLHQTFMGVPSNIGEDRALTSILLRNNYHVVLQADAKVVTRVPTTYAQLCRTLIRWTRGDVREGLLMIRHFFTRWPRDLRTAVLQFILVFQLFGLTLPIIAMLLLPLSVPGNAAALGVVLVYLAAVNWLWATVPALLYAEKESPVRGLYAFAVGFFNLIALSWICVYSWITVRNSRWMTRDVRRKDDAGVCVSPRRIS